MCDIKKINDGKEINDQTKSKFDNFTFKSYSDQYLCKGPLYDLLYNLLEKLEPTIQTITEVGCGPNAPASRFLNQTSKHAINYTFLEPSKASKELIPFVQSLKNGSKGVIIQQSASSKEAKEQPPADVVVANRMIHEWRLYELSQKHEWTVKDAVQILLGLTKRGGHVIVGDFCFDEEYAQLKDDDPRLIEDMARLTKRIGHSHEPRNYITLDQIKEACKELGVAISYSHVIEKPEPDTHRVYWMAVINKN
ncbi:hypothetical protein M9Y10_018126 [Tritrichomonas musculus]|uniref:Methyltransferase type 12 domain-containing protein n=1 Tax=Tritrichomonas musculus TaxID=1915356 RepID=A0ABR2HPI4_9EUKA